MASEVIKLNLIPKGEMPVFHASQFDTGRLITCELYRGEDAYSVPEGYTVELHCRKVDNNIVTMASTLINDNVVTFTSTEQLTACNGNNLCEVAILDEGYRIGTLNFILEVEIDPLKGGITSTSEIHNLETQVEEITTEIIGENYYNKTEVDDLLDAKADASSVYTKTQVDSALALKANAADVYTKSQTDILLSAKANSSDVYTKGQVDTALAAKADVSDLPDMDLYYTKTATDTLLAAKADASTVTAALATKADKSDTYTKEQVDDIILGIMPVDTAGPASIASFDTALAADLVDCKTTLDPSLTGYTAVNLTANGDTTTIALGDTYYGGTLDVTTGVLTVNYAQKDLGSLNWTYNSSNSWRGAIADSIRQTNPNTTPDWICSDANIPIKTQNNPSFPSISGLDWFTGVCFWSNDYTTAGQVATALNGTYLTYKLATPVTVQLSPTAVSAIVGANNVFSDTGDITVKYKDSIQHYIDKKVST